MGFIQDYLLYNSGNECPRNYHLWSAYAVLSAVVSRKVHLNLSLPGEDSYFPVHPNIYVGLIGKQGNRKSTAKDIARDMLTENFPKIPVAASVMTREKITQFLSTPESIRVYKDPSGVITEYHPFTLFINELKNFLSVNPTGMIDFLTDIYDRKFFDVGTKNAGDDFIVNPCFVMLACETPEWIMKQLRMEVLTGGWARRMIYVYEIDEGARIPFPSVTKEAKAAYERCIVSLKLIEPVVGCFEWTDEARKVYSDWYLSRPSPADPIMAGFYRSKHIQMLKVAMLIALSDDYTSLILRPSNIELALASIDAIEENMQKLSQGIGNNILAAPTTKMLELINAMGGEILEKKLQQIMFRDMDPKQYPSVIEHLIKTEQIFLIARTSNNIERRFVATAERIEHLKTLKDKQPPI